jgi:hypothetical protein
LYLRNETAHKGAAIKLFLAICLTLYEVSNKDPKFRDCRIVDAL